VENQKKCKYCKKIDVFIKNMNDSQLKKPNAKFYLKCYPAESAYENGELIAVFQYNHMPLRYCPNGGKKVRREYNLKKNG
jgi:hypothetical protein